MATWLSLSKDVGRDTGTLPNWSSLTSVLAADGASERAQKIGQWVNEAWRNIQLEREDWFWMRADFTSALIINQQSYAPTAAPFSLSRFGDWHEDDPYGFGPISIYDPAEGVTDQGELAQIHYLDWQRKWNRGSHDADRPVDWAVAPNGDLVVGPKPDKAYVIKGFYQKSPQEFAANADVPEMPVRYHNLIKWEAIRLLRIAGAGWDEMSAAAQEIRRLKDALLREQLPEIRLGGESF